MEHVRVFFGANSCMVVIRAHDAQAWSLRTASGPESRPAVAIPLDQDAAAPLVAFAPDQLTAFSAPLYPLAPWRGEFHIRDGGQARWRRAAPEQGERLADLLDGRSFICAPIPLRQGEGWVYVVAPNSSLRKEDAMFLAQVAAQAYPVIENIELLDRMASDAARRERQRIANDLHDTTVQPYIGLAHALNAMLERAADDNPLRKELRQVADMASQFVSDLRRYAGGIRDDQSKGDPVFLMALRAHAAHVKQFYDLDITLTDQDALGINDRLGAEIFQIVSEAVSNIRRHTNASKGTVGLRCINGWLHILVRNECPAGPAPPFLPRSISERAAALGGYTYVAQCEDGGTAVHVDIPV